MGSDNATIVKIFQNDVNLVGIAEASLQPIHAPNSTDSVQIFRLRARYLMQPMVPSAALDPFLAIQPLSYKLGIRTTTLLLVKNRGLFRRLSWGE